MFFSFVYGFNWLEKYFNDSRNRIEHATFVETCLNMERLIIEVDNNANAGLLMRLFRSLSFVKAVRKTDKSEEEKLLPKSKFTTKKEFWETFGTGVDSSIDIGQIKENAWRSHKR